MSIEILAYEPTPLGVLCLRRRELTSVPGVHVTEVTLDHEFLMSSLYTDSERALVTTAATMHGGSGLRVMVGGLGLGYTAHTALASERVASVKVVELLPQVIDWMTSGLVPLSDEMNAERAAGRLTLTEGDAYARLLAEPDEPAQQFDLILIDVDHSPADRLDDRFASETGSASQRFYTRAGLATAKRHLAPGGVLGVWSYAESSPFADALRDTFDEVRIEPISHFNEMIDQKQTDWLFFARGC